MSQGLPEFATVGLPDPSVRESRERVRTAILNGAKPSDLAVEQPTRFELVLNLRSAKALGLKISPALRLRADHIIE